MGNSQDRAAERFLRGAVRRARRTTWLLGILVLCGCQWSKQRQAHCDEQCQRLCSQAREAHRNGQGEAARELVDAAMRNRPQELTTRLQIVELLWQQGRKDVAMDCWQNLEREFSDDVRPVIRQAECAWELEQYGHAYDKALRATQLDPRLSSAWRIRARDEIRRGELEQACATSRAWVEANPQDSEALVTLGGVQLRRGHPDRAAPILRQALEQQQLESAIRQEAQWLLGQAYFEQERWAEAANMWSSVLASKGDFSAKEWSQLATAQKQNGDFTGARRSAQAAVNRDPNNTIAIAMLRELPERGPIRTVSAELIDGFPQRDSRESIPSQSSGVSGLTRPRRN